MKWTSVGAFQKKEGRGRQCARKTTRSRMRNGPADEKVKTQLGPHVRKFLSKLTWGAQ